jgi:hypothetical protein
MIGGIKNNRLGMIAQKTDTLNFASSVTSFLSIYNQIITKRVVIGMAAKKPAKEVCRLANSLRNVIITEEIMILKIIGIVKL